MSLTAVELSSDVYMVCMSHALTTEKEEIMGLLLGDIERSSRGVIADVTGMTILTRSDKRNDRVEISPEQLAAATAEAEALSKTLKKTTRVIGWYHSHPHITVQPSHIDVNTQAQYQMMEDGFLGLIFSVYNVDPKKRGRIQVIAFQAIDLNAKPAPAPRTSPAPTPSEAQTKDGEQLLSLGGAASATSVSPSSSAPVIEEERTKLFSFNIPGAPQADISVVIHTVVDKTVSGQQTAASSSAAAASSSVNPSSAFPSAAPTSSFTSVYQQALPQQQASSSTSNVSSNSAAASSAAASLPRKEGGVITAADYGPPPKRSGFQQIDIPLRIVPARARGPRVLEKLAQLQTILLQEERAAYDQSLVPRKPNSKEVHPVLQLHSAAVYQKALCRNLEIGCAPLLQMLQDRSAANTERIKQLEEEKKKLMAM